MMIELNEGELLRLVTGVIMAFACGVNAWVAYHIYRRASGWRRTAYTTYAIAVMVAAGINSYIRLQFHLADNPIGFPDWQALFTGPLYLFAGIQGVRTLALGQLPKRGERVSHEIFKTETGEPDAPNANDVNITGEIDVHLISKNEEDTS